MSIRPKKVPAGQADGIRPRTIEVLQVKYLCIRIEGSTLNFVYFDRVMDWQIDYFVKEIKCIWLYVSPHRYISISLSHDIFISLL